MGQKNATLRQFLIENEERGEKQKQEDETKELREDIKKTMWRG